MFDYYKAETLSTLRKIKHGFFGRHHGVLKNLVQENRDFSGITDVLKIDPAQVVTLNQVHSAKPVVVYESITHTVPQADALITKIPGLYLGVYTADCVPVLLSSANGDMVAAVHAGWRGALLGIVENTIKTMRDLGAKSIVAALGPAIWQDSYEVSNDFYEKFNAPAFFKPKTNEGSWLFDLPAFVKSRLELAGLSRIEDSPFDTYRLALQFYSYRRKCHNPKEDYKSNFSVIGIEPY